MRITIDPRDFISPPYIKCPKCKKTSWGILHIAPHAYSRRCRECMFPHPSRNEPDAWFNLPPLDKKVIYLDQLAISNMMKAINPKMKAYREGKVDKFWLRLFEKLSSLSQLQLIVCPESSTQENESLLSPYFKDLERMYKLLSWGVRFHHPAQIKKIQLCNYAQNWFEGNPSKEPIINTQEIVHGEINAWQNHYRIVVDLGDDRPWKDVLINDRERIHANLGKRFESWQKQGHKTFGDWFEEECIGVGRVIMKGFVERLASQMTNEMYNIKPDIEDIYGTPRLIVDSLFQSFINLGVNAEESFKLVGKVLVHNSKELKNVPFVRIFSTLCAALAHETAHEGRKRKPNRGMYTDMITISVLLPYCEAIFVDNECRGLLGKIPKGYEIDYGTRVFSLSNKEEFLEYLDGIESNASKEHMEAIKEVYGEDCPTPFTEVYTYRQE